MRIAALLRRSVAVAALSAGVAMTFGAAPASAHADLADASPRAGAVLEGAPIEIVLDFSSDVEQGLAHVELLDSSGAQVLLDPVLDTPDDSQVVVPVHAPDDLGAGVYVVRYRITSPDSHVQQDAFAFQIGRTAGSQADVLASIGLPQPSVGLDWFVGILRWLSFLGMALLIGSWLVAALDARSGEEVPARRSPAGALGWVAILVLAVSTVLLFAGHGALSEGRGLGGLTDASAWSHVAGARFGMALLVRLVLVGLASLVVGGNSLAGRPAWRTSAAVVALCIALTFGLAGHAGVDRLPGVGLLLDALHLLATTLWVGGLLVLLVGRRTWLGSGVRADGAVAGGGGVASGVIRALPWALGVIVVTGVLQTWRVVRSASTFGASAYGNLLIGKGAVVLVTVLVLVVGWSASRRTGSMVATRLLVAQVVVGVVALGCSAELVARSPESALSIAPVTVTASEAGVSVSVTATPARVGGNDFHVLIERQGSATPSADVRMSISRPEAGIGEADVPLAPDGPDHYSAFGFRIPSAGTWQLSIEVDAADGTTTKLTASLRIAG